MGRKCSVGGCKSNYKSQEHLQPQPISVYGFPKDIRERERWLASLPNRIDPERITGNYGVCAKHFASDIPMIRHNGHLVPGAPRTIFDNVPQSCIPNPPDQPRPTKEFSSEVRARTMNIDEMEDFKEMDKFGSTLNFISALKSKFQEHIVAISNDNLSFMILSQARGGPVHAFLSYSDICVNSETGTIISLKCELCYNLKLVNHPGISSEDVTCWSQLEELIRFLSVTKSEDSMMSIKDEFLLPQVQLQNAPRNNAYGLYSVDDLSLALKWCIRSRSLYNEIRNYLQLPSLSTLSRVTRAVKNSSDEDLHKKVFDNLQDRCKNCTLIIDEIYVKASISYRGGVLFGYAVDRPEKWLLPYCALW